MPKKAKSPKERAHAARVAFIDALSDMEPRDALSTVHQLLVDALDVGSIEQHEEEEPLIAAVAGIDEWFRTQDIPPLQKVRKPITEDAPK